MDFGLIGGLEPGTGEPESATPFEAFEPAR